jgi:hypothetical protein
MKDRVGYNSMLTTRWGFYKSFLGLHICQKAYIPVYIFSFPIYISLLCKPHRYGLRSQSVHRSPVLYPLYLLLKKHL